MRQSRKERNELLSRLKKKMNELREEGKKGVVALNVKRPGKPRITKEQSLSEVLKNPQAPKEKNKEKFLDITVRGKIKWLNLRLGYGFITGEDGRDVFIHHSNTKEALVEGDEVEFKVEETEKGLSAIKLIKI